QALALMTRYAEGSLRDAENLLEQAIVSFETDLNESQIRTLLNLDSDDVSIGILGSIVDGNIKNTLLTLNESLENGTNPNLLQRSLLEVSRAILLIKSGNISELNFSDTVKTQLIEISDKVNFENIVKIIRMLVGYKTDNKIASNLALELVCVEAIIISNKDFDNNDANFLENEEKQKLDLQLSNDKEVDKLESKVKNDVGKNLELKNSGEIANRNNEQSKKEQSKKEPNVVASSNTKLNEL
ncbi:uncharacterized protein METZ01_LOCUS483319, partial [marine metagenome]